MKRILLLLWIIFAHVHADAQKIKNTGKKAVDTLFLTELLSQYPSFFKNLTDHPDSFRIQIIYTKIDRDQNNRPKFTEYHYHVQDSLYFYPASTVKMPVAFLALEKIHELNIPGLDRRNSMMIDSAFSGQSVVYNQPNSADGRPTIENYIRQIFLVSSNDAFNRLYEFLGPQYIRKKLAKKGYPDIIIRHRLDLSLTPTENQRTNPVRFLDSIGDYLYQQPASLSKVKYPNLSVQLGNGFMQNGKLIHQPFDFSFKNRVYLRDQHHLLQSVLFPESVAKSARFNLSDSDYHFLYHWMSAYPRESDHPNYDPNDFHDAYCKFLLYGSEKGKLPATQRIFNKVGDAYGFLTDIAYYADPEQKVEFMLSCSIYCNRDGIFNDDHYDYETIGLPFMKHLGEVILQYEKQRIRKYPPDLSRFKMTY